MEDDYQYLIIMVIILDILSMNTSTIKKKHETHPIDILTKSQDSTLLTNNVMKRHYLNKNGDLNDNNDGDVLMTERTEKNETPLSIDVMKLSINNDVLSSSNDIYEYNVNRNKPKISFESIDDFNRITYYGDYAREIVDLNYDNDFDNFDDDSNEMNDNDNIDFPIIDDTLQTPKKKVIDYFKLSIFNNNTNSNKLLSTDVNEEMATNQQSNFKKKYFWKKRNNKKGIIKNDDTDGSSDSIYFNDDSYEDRKGSPCLRDNNDIITEETDVSILINPSKLIVNRDVEENMTSSDQDPSESLSSFDVSVSNSPSQLPLLSSNTNPFKIRTDSNKRHVNEHHCEDKSAVSLEKYSARSHSDNKENINGTLPKTRGRKPSLIPDASKQFGCEYCERRFKRQEHLKRHVRSLHIGVKPYTCHICQKNFSRSDNLSQHIKTHG
ncbi:Com2p NDAI_0B01930 [Naumovozyma dairenensis CBS 421]|uniref:C2H2-type domain-containing protein n=1 Tax=Naumovozyma dairenensis (strain ATCC 10597 / BCRC 20456 / CBS 421 / NBRC 0211 / NRRL Y-12639) TaxID=1071378 RepID=G0W617_NAUDC|nr:hypothetical protein NDAI_0B01930 [Naumovozyma dairenensis CBS 421]CCD23228.1 hypothetical protein NDAI_0B01930 [Naumovozyma dairenensis CBS 421]